MTAAASSPRTLLHAQGIAKRFGTRPVLYDENLDVEAGEAVAIVGENGSGKSTLLRIIAGVVPADSGRVQLHGSLGYCPQQPGLIDLLTVDDHLALFGAGLGLTAAEAAGQGQALLRDLGYRPERERPAKFLSGGNRQKLNLALALLGNPAVLLLDEPYQGFDFGTYVNFWERVDTWRGQGRAIVIVTHMLAELTRVDRVVELRWRDSDSVGGATA